MQKPDEYKMNKPIPQILTISSQEHLLALLGSYKQINEIKQLEKKKNDDLTIYKKKSSSKNHFFTNLFVALSIFFLLSCMFPFCCQDFKTKSTPKRR